MNQNKYYLRCVKTQKILYVIGVANDSIIRSMKCTIGGGKHWPQSKSTEFENGYLVGGIEGDYICPIGTFTLKSFHYNEKGFVTTIDNKVYNLGKMKIDISCKNQFGQDKGIRLHKAIDINGWSHGCIGIDEDNLNWIYDNLNPGAKIIIESQISSIASNDYINEGLKTSDLDITGKQKT